MSTNAERLQEYLRGTFTLAVAKACLAGTLTNIFFLHHLTRFTAIQIFMWIYMVSFFLEVPRETKKRRLPYILISLTILLLTTSSAILEGVSIYTSLFLVTPGEENALAGLEMVESFETRLITPATLLWDITLRISDGVLVSDLTLCKATQN